MAVEQPAELQRGQEEFVTPNETHVKNNLIWANSGQDHVISLRQRQAASDLVKNTVGTAKRAT